MSNAVAGGVHNRRGAAFTVAGLSSAAAFLGAAVLPLVRRTARLDTLATEMIAGTTAVAPIVIALCSVVISTLSLVLAFQVRRDQRQARIEQRRAYLTAAQSASQRGERDVYEFRVANAGWFPARHVVGIIENDREGVIADGGILMVAKDQQEVLKIEVPRGALDPSIRSFLTLRWHDPNGVITREHVLQIEPVD